MLRRTALIAALVVLGGGALLAFSLSHVSSDDRRDYLQLVETTEQQPMLMQHQLSPGQQRRRGVTKDLYLIENGRRLHSHFASDASTVQFTFRHGQAELEELMDRVEGTIQDDLFYRLADGGEAVELADGSYHMREGHHLQSEAIAKEEGWQPMQHVRHIEARAARYQFHTGRFCGSDVSFRRFSSPGHALADIGTDQQELMWGQARDVELCLGKERVDFRASHLRATIYSPRGML